MLSVASNGKHISTQFYCLNHLHLRRKVIYCTTDSLSTFTTSMINCNGLAQYKYVHGKYIELGGDNR